MEDSNAPLNSTSTCEINASEGVGDAASSDYLNASNYVGGLAMLLRINKEHFSPKLSKNGPKRVIGNQMPKYRV